MKHLLKVIWEALHDYRENCIPEGRPTNDEQWEEICYVMAKLEEQYHGYENMYGFLFLPQHHLLSYKNNIKSHND